MSVKITGFDNLNKQLKQLEKSANELNKIESLSFEELLPTSFLRKYTPFSSMDELLDASGFKVESQEDFKAIPDDEFDKFIAENTKFKSWRDMLGEAASQYAAKKLGF